MESEKIQVRAETGQLVEVVVLSKRPDRIDVVIGEAVRCSLTPTRNGLAYSGTVRGRELIYERSRADVEAEIARRDPGRRRFR